MIKIARTDDPIADFYNWDAAQEAWLKTRPVCDSCGEPIQEDYKYEYEGQTFCEECFLKIVKKDCRVRIPDTD